MRCGIEYIRDGMVLGLTILFLAVAVSPCQAVPTPPAPGNYTASAHGNTSTGVNRSSIDAKFNTSIYSIGNCGHCHEMHASVGGSEPAPVGGAASVYAGFATEENLCNTCHDGAPATDDVKTIITTKTYKHNVAGYSGVHRSFEDRTRLSANKHVECTDCHNPHEGDSTKHSTGTNAIGTDSPLRGVKGAVATFGAEWATPTYTLQTATKEYEICFKCHSGFNTSLSSWGGSGAAAWTDVGLEYNPNNSAFHPIAATSGAAGGATALVAAQLVAPWAANVGNQTMYCSDCHNVDSGTVMGPHGSSVKWMLSGTNQRWPYSDGTANNGTSAGTFYYLSGTTAGLFCINCHPSPTSASSNNAHRKSDHQNAADGTCVYCHIRVPHGGKVSRLMSADNAGNVLPARYKPDGNGGGGIGFRQFKLAAKDSYTKPNCKADCAGDHSSNVTSYESW